MSRGHFIRLWGDFGLYESIYKEKIVSDFLQEERISIAVENIKIAYRIVDFCFKQSIETQKTSKEKEDFLIAYNTQLFKVLGLSLKSNLWAEKLFEKFENCKRWILFPDTFSTLDLLKQAGFTLAVVANWDKNLIDLLDQFNVSQFFTLILSSAEINEEKPNPRIIHYAMKKMHIIPDGTFYVGNEYEMDVIVARRAGVEPILIDRDNILPYADCLKFLSLSEMATYLINIQKEKAGRNNLGEKSC